MFFPPHWMSRGDKNNSGPGVFTAKESSASWEAPKHPFRNILRFIAGDFVAKTINFLAFVYLARTLGVDSYGVLEFAISVLTYFLKVSDGGLEMWAMRAAARGTATTHLVGRVVPIRSVLALVAFTALLVLLPTFPNYGLLRTLLVIFGLTALVEGVNLRWVFMGQERLARVAIGSVVGQVVFAAGVFAVVGGPEALVLIAVLRLVSDLVMACYFLWLFINMHDRSKMPFSLRGAGTMLREALPLGVTHFLGLASYNFDTVLLGFLRGPEDVGLYNAAYRPVTVALAVPMAYFHGLFPILSRTLAQSETEFRTAVRHSLRVTATCALPIGIGATFLAEPIVGLVFGSEYLPAAPALRLLGWSAALIVLRGTFRQGLLAAGHQALDLRCSTFSVALNMALNFVLIPMYGILGAAVATVTSEVAWLALAVYLFRGHVMSLSLLPFLWRPLMGAVVMVCCFLAVSSWPWMLQMVTAVALYLPTLLLTHALTPSWDN
jgi:O-antigen/teichoic acid export membrane protein